MKCLFFVLGIVMSLTVAAKEKEKMNRVPAKAGEYVCTDGVFSEEQNHGFGYSTLAVVSADLSAYCQTSKPFQVIQLKNEKFGFCCIQK